MGQTDMLTLGQQITQTNFNDLGLQLLRLKERTREAIEKNEIEEKRLEKLLWSQEDLIGFLETGGLSHPFLSCPSTLRYIMEVQEGF